MKSLTRTNVIPFLKNLLTSSRLTRLVNLARSEVDVIIESTTKITTKRKEDNLLKIFSKLILTVKKPDLELGKMMTRKLPQIY